MRMSIVKQFVAYSLGMLSLYSAINLNAYLQSSINIQKGLGSTALGCMYFSATVFGLLSTSPLIRRIGPKKCILLSELSGMIFVASNYYPTYFTMLPAAIMGGFSESLTWPSISLLNVYFGTEYWKSKGTRTTRSSGYFVHRFTGYYFSIHHCSHILGGVLGFSILHFGSNGSPDVVTGDGNFTTANLTTTASIANDNSSNIDYLQQCGSNDCQIQNEVAERLEVYVPADRLVTNILISSLLLVCVFAVVLHTIVLPDIRPRGTCLRTTKRETSEDRDIIPLQRQDSGGALLQSPGKDTSLKKNEDKDVDHEYSPLEKADAACCTIVLQTLKDVGGQLMKTKQLLIIPITFYQGMLMIVVFCELPRAYVSCVIGYSSISVSMCFYGAGHVIATSIVGRIGKAVGRTAIFIVIACLDTSNLLFCLLWTPSTDTSWLVFVSFFAFGLADGTWQPLINVAHMEYFPNHRHVAGSVWTATVCLGLAVSLSWSNAFCVYQKIYIMFGVLGLGLTLVCIAERIHEKEERRRNKADVVNNFSGKRAESKAMHA